jgi:AcrR family transcriptional regulator
MSPKAPSKRKRRQSPRVEERRGRIIDKARELVASRGIEALTIRDLADECGVAVATLYNQFGSREAVIGAALEVDFRGRFEPLIESTRALTPAEKLDHRITAATRAILTDLREYTRSVMFFYFHHAAQPELRAAIHDYAVSDFQHIVEEIAQSGDLQPWVNARNFADDIITQDYALVMKWAQGHIKDRDLRPRAIRALGASFIGITRGRTREEFEALVASQR